MKSQTGLKVRTVQFKPNSRNLFFHILTQCNLRCKHCYINQDAQGKEILDSETIFNWLKIFANRAVSFEEIPLEGNFRFKGKFRLPHEHVAEQTNVIFLGGEPTLNPALPEAIRYARDLGFRSITVDTNGYLFHDFLNKVTPGLVDNICFSLDGSTPQTNDPIRGHGAFERCTQGIREAISGGFNVSVIFTVSMLNIHDLARMPHLLQELGVENFFIQVVGIRGRPAKEGDYGLQVGRTLWEEVVPKVAKEAASLGITVTYPKVYLGKNEDFSCAGVDGENYFVFPNGRVYICPLCEDLAVHSFEIKDNVLKLRPPITELDLIALNIPEGCVMNKILHPENIPYGESGEVLAKVACCMLKEEVRPG
ncbi:Radical SAM domain protein [Dissulfuribacter thermophilus]|uniref:Radical SAM domain protein n=1 Tax=Dissulfuribacter thermophilus TaxID=1156395 RepID=A0A1B9F4Y1_9BACT|nr:radical SAM protein [Dissulfuribacter thermophilus]OCC14986.1 Radical SAM domain protein [Dissulfuribacter thermophilus]